MGEQVAGFHNIPGNVKQKRLIRKAIISWTRACLTLADLINDSSPPNDYTNQLL